jgi:hypothetical protein
MRKKYALQICVFCAVVLTMLNACTKGVDATQNGCEQLACAQALPIIILDFIDKQGRDLLNPATPGHYDSLKIMQLNPAAGISIIRAGVTPPNINHRKIVLNAKTGENTTYLKLSDTDQDTVYYNMQITNSCCINHKLTAFSYNGKANTDSLKSRYFIIVK